MLKVVNTKAEPKGNSRRIDVIMFWVTMHKVLAKDLLHASVTSKFCFGPVVVDDDVLF